LLFQFLVVVLWRIGMESPPTSPSTCAFES
jgi:hypothetical protein